MKITKIKTGEYGSKLLTKVRLFVIPEGERLIDNLDNRHCRPHQVYRKEILPLVFAKLQLPWAKAAWKQNAGCSCGCSPGFVLEVNPLDVGYDAIWVTVR